MCGELLNGTTFHQFILLFPSQSIPLIIFFNYSYLLHFLQYHLLSHIQIFNLCFQVFILLFLNIINYSLIYLQAHEVLIQNTDKGSVITWDFDVMRHDVVFSVFRTKDPLLNKKPSSANQPSSAAFNMCVNTDPEQFTSIGRGWKEGTDYFRVEAPIVCHDGESIQVG